jgi:hypothetical protein
MVKRTKETALLELMQVDRTVMLERLAVESAESRDAENAIKKREGRQRRLERLRETARS